MSQASPNLVDRIRQPEYVGENRCTPCTIVNVVIALVVSVVAWFVAAPAGATLAGSLAGGVLFVSLAAIYLRGYLVPGTPTLTKRYFPDRVLRWFEKDPSAVDAPVAGSEGDIQPEPILLEAGAVEFCEGGEDLCATSEFTTEWRDEIEFLRDGGDIEERLAPALEADPDEIDVEIRDSSAVVTRDEQAVAQWESEAALLADAAAFDPLSNRVGEWEDLDVSNRGQLLNGVRVFLEQCPSCDGPLGFSEDTRESCCREVEIIALECTECESLLLEVEAQPEAHEDASPEQPPSPEDISAEDLPAGVEMTELSDDDLPDHIDIPEEAMLPPVVEELPQDVSQDDLPDGVVPKDAFLENLPPAEPEGEGPPVPDVSSEDLPPGVELTDLSEGELPDHIDPDDALLPPVVEELPEDVSPDDLPRGVIPKDELLENLPPEDMEGGGPPAGPGGQGPPPGFESEGPPGGNEPPSPPEDLTSDDLPTGVELLDVTEDDLPDVIEVPEGEELPYIVDELPEDVSRDDLPFGVVPIDHFDEMAERAEREGEVPPSGPGNETPEPEE